LKGNFYTLIFAACLGAVCALLLTSAATFTAPYQATNKEAEEILNILTALQVPLDLGISPEQLVEIFSENVDKEIQGERTLYVYSPPDAQSKPEAIAISFSGPGLWAPIKGILALESDRVTIRGITFYEHEETPGLGGEIVSSGFRDQFAGKSIIDESGKAGIVIQSGGNEFINGVDAITGATMTCDKVQSMLNEVINTIVEQRGQDG
jgi:Na+-transporting NADH:ubiquinone oxidoreductase subunit C